jgi:hypothetical protein
MRQSKARFGLLIIPAIIIVLDMVYFILDDILDEGRSFLYLDAYNRGYLTWWLDFEEFWGNFELWTAIGAFTGIFAIFGYGVEPGTKRENRTKVLKLLAIIVLSIIGVAVVFGTVPSLAPYPYSIGNIIVYGWFSIYFPQRMLLVFVIMTGFWLYFSKLFSLREQRTFYKFTLAMGMIAIAISLVFLHQVIIATWDLDAVNNLRPLVTELIGFCFVTIPIFAFTVASNELHWHVENATPVRQIAQVPKSRAIFLIIYPSVAAVAIATFLFLVASINGIHVSLDINSSFVPKGMITWIYTALIASIVYFGVQKEESIT